MILVMRATPKATLSLSWSWVQITLFRETVFRAPWITLIGAANNDDVERNDAGRSSAQLRCVAFGTL
jgi:hypothetical protein